MQLAPDLTQMLREMRHGDRDQTDYVVRALYAELRTLAARQLRHEYRVATLQPTELVAECFLKLFQGSQPEWNGRAHFFGVAARLMRQVLIDRARKRKASKRPDEKCRVVLDDAMTGKEDELWQLVALDEALKRLEHLEPRLCRIVELRFFAGLDVEQTAEAVGLSPATVRRDWTFTRAWLHRELC